MSEPNKPTSPNSTESEDQAHGNRQLVLVKRGQRFIFRYGPGDELRVLADLKARASDPTCDLDWFDVAVLSHQMGQRIAHQFEDLLKPPAI